MALSKRVALVSTSATSGTLNPAVAVLSPTLIATRDIGTDDLQAWSRDTETDAIVIEGNSLFELSMGSAALCRMTSTRVASFETKDDRLDAYDYSAPSWSLVGNRLAVGATSPGTLTRLSDTRVARVEGNGDTLRAYDFDGTNWSQVGNSYSVAGADTTIEVASLSSTRVVVGDVFLGGIRVLDFDGTNWSLVGNVYTAESFAQFSRMTGIDASHFVAYMRSYNGHWALFEFDGTDIIPTGHRVKSVGSTHNDIDFIEGEDKFIAGVSGSLLTYELVDVNPGDITASLIGNRFGQVGVYADVSVTTLNETDVVHAGSSFFAGQSVLQLMRFDGTDWSIIGNPLVIAADFGAILVTALGPTTVAVMDNILDILRTYTFDGTDWTQVGNSLAEPLASTGSLIKLEGNVVAHTYIDAKIQAYEFDGTDWAATGTPFSHGAVPVYGAYLGDNTLLLYLATTRELRRCKFDGSTWAFLETGTDISSLIPAGGQIATLAAFSATQIFMYSISGDYAYTFEFDGSAWVQTGYPYFIYQLGGTVAASVLTGNQIAWSAGQGGDFMTIAFENLEVEMDVTPDLFWTTLSPDATQGAS